MRFDITLLAYFTYKIGSSDIKSFILLLIFTLILRKLSINMEVIFIGNYLLRTNKELLDRVKLAAKHERLSINKMLIKLIEIGLIVYYGGGKISNENVTEQINSK